MSLLSKTAGTALALGPYPIHTNYAKAQAKHRPNAPKRVGPYFKASFQSWLASSNRPFCNSLLEQDPQSEQYFFSHSLFGQFCIYQLTRYTETI
jgi:hypothetical protein